MPLATTCNHNLNPSINIFLRSINEEKLDEMLKEIKQKEKNLCIINIAGGTAYDSINALIIVSKNDNRQLFSHNNV